MPKQQNDALVDLIRSLTKAEKRHFMLYARRNASKSDALFIKLFEQISRRGKFEEEAILKAVPQIRKSQIPNLRSKLYREILISLRLLQGQNRVDISIREYLDYAQLLYDKGLYRQSLNVLDKAKIKAQGATRNNLLLEINTFEKLIETQHITRSIDSRADELSDESNALIPRIAGEVKFSNLSLQLYGLYLKMGHARNKAEEAQVKDYFVRHLPTFSESSLTFFEKVYLYQSYVWLYQITQEFAKQYRYAWKWVSLFHDNQDHIQNNVPLYLKGLHNLLNAQYLTFHYERFNETLDELVAFNSDGALFLTENEKSLQTLFTYIHKLNAHFLNGTFSSGTKWIPELRALIEENVYNWDVHRQMVFFYKIACIYFGAGQNEQAIEMLNKVNSASSASLREDIQCFSRILSLIAHFEIGNDILVSYQIKSVYRFLLKMKEMNATHAEILKFVRRTPAMIPDQVKEEFEALRVRLIETQHSRFENRSNLYLDIISWLESKINNRPVQDIIREKYKERLALRER